MIPIASPERTVHIEYLDDVFPSEHPETYPSLLLCSSYPIVKEELAIYIHTLSGNEICMSCYFKLSLSSLRNYECKSEWNSITTE